MNICAIVINYFGIEDTIPCVRSLLHQGISKIVILDNSAETNQEKALLKAFEGRPQVKVIGGKHNMGFAGGVNFVLRRMVRLPFDAYLLVNNDTLASHELVQALVKGIESASLHVAAPYIFEYPMKEILWSKGNYYNNITGTITQRPIPSIPKTQYYLTGCCLMIKKEVIDEIGLFDEAFFMYGEDIEFCHRAQERGFRLGAVKEALIYHRVNASAQSNSLFYEYHINRSHLILSKKLSRTTFEYVAVFTLKWIMMGIRALLRTMRYRNLNALRGYWMATTDKRVPGRLKAVCSGP
jgi:N-acetylglucosaminyl-diphospho-decaprenol L-rhamnosyltransferase